MIIDLFGFIQNSDDCFVLVFGEVVYLVGNILDYVVGVYGVIYIGWFYFYFVFYDEVGQLFNQCNGVDVWKIMLQLMYISVYFFRVFYQFLFVKFGSNQ